MEHNSRQADIFILKLLIPRKVQTCLSHWHPWTFVYGKYVTELQFLTAAIFICCYVYPWRYPP